MSLTGNSIGIMAGCAIQDPKKVTTVPPMLILPLMMFSGIYNKINSIPVVFRWLQYMSPFRYGLHSVMQN